MLGIFGLLFLLMFFRIFYIQATGVAEGENLPQKAAALYQKSIVEKADRGNILDRNGAVIATDTLSYRLIAIINPEASNNSKEKIHVEDKKATAKEIAKYIDLSEAKIYELLTHKLQDGRTPYQVEFGQAGRDLSHGKMIKIRDAKIQGVQLLEETKRFYPNGMFASNIIGFAQKQKNDDGSFVNIGQVGLEKTFNKELSGTNGSVNFSKDNWGYVLPNSKQMIKAPKNGDNIYLTTDKTIQNILENEVTKVDKEYTPESIVAVVANPKTGEILASTQRPTYNPQTGEGINTSWLNQLTETTIEPGSTMKTFTVATAIEEGVWNENATFMSGQYRVGGRTIRDANQVGWGRISYLEGIQRSSNVGMANLLNSIGGDNFMKSLHKFGFGEKTGIDLPNETAGKLLDQYQINKVTTTYGQGSTVTPIQLIQALSAVANDGDMMQPYIIKKIVDPNTGKIVLNNTPTVKGTPISAETAKETRRLLATTVTSEKGTARNFANKEYEVAGKTGTAQIPNSAGGYYWGKGKFLYSFLGMAPAKDPQLTMYVAIKKPKLKATESGSEPSAKIFNAVMQSSLKYLNVKPESKTNVDTVTLPDFTDDKVSDAATKLTKMKFEPIIIGDNSQVTEQYPAAGQSLMKTGKIFIKTSGKITLPDFKGWSIRDILAYSELSGLTIKLTGNGYAVKQKIAAGTTVSTSDVINVEMKTPREQYTSKK
ncbi:penicillin-binding protein [Kurthia sibirica]|nr:penicillin-binding protein [Kurthia sibirica]GEK32648.1 penicillin-binding protein 2B [Kurthia sibirica]